MKTIWPPSQDSIFGDTYGGVPNPNVPHRHPWPTRYHGPIWTVPDAAQNQYAPRPYARPPFMGMGAAPIFEHVTGHGVVDGALGALMGYVGSPTAQDKVMWAIVGGLAGYAAGMAGLLGAGGLLLYSRSQRKVATSSK